MSFTHCWRGGIFTEQHNSKDREIEDLKRRLENQGPMQHAGPVQPQPPVIGHGPRDLFGQIMAGGGAQGPTALGPPPPEPQQPQGLPGHLTQGAGLNTGHQMAQHQGFAGYQSGTSINGKDEFCYFRRQLYANQYPQVTANNLHLHLQSRPAPNPESIAEHPVRLHHNPMHQSLSLDLLDPTCQRRH